MDWKNRKKLILNYIKKQSPDIIFLQECFDDRRYNVPKNHQAKQLNQELKYNECIYDVAEKLKTENKKPLNVSVSDGLGCLSRFKILKKDVTRLTQSKEDKHYRIIQRLLIKVKNKEILFYHTHYSNRDDWAREQFVETIKLVEKGKIQPIIIGDLNIRLLNDIKEITSTIYKNSWDFKNYISYPSKNEVLDYTLIPNKMNFKSVICNKDGLSDHRPLITEININ